jgi:hypothetical protein
MPFVIPLAPYLNPYLCDVCGCGIGLDGLLESGMERIVKQLPSPVWGRILCNLHANSEMNQETS